MIPNHFAMNSHPIHRSLLFGAFASILLIVIIAARPNHEIDLERRVADLERRVAQLEQERGVGSSSSTVR